MYFVYILQSEKDGSLYTGQTINLIDRIKRHNQGLIKTTKTKRPFRLGYYEIYGSRSEAMYREWQFKKQWNTERKKRLIADFDQAKIKEVLGL
ncbi:MAG: GIY-YIG nuclease family protein [Ignavibacteriales bacterium]|nr:GIY-YIG nuclease family protein [Ignavibacteriales bacterium]